MHMRYISTRRDDGVYVLPHKRLMLDVRQGESSAREESNRLHSKKVIQTRMAQLGIRGDCTELGVSRAINARTGQERFPSVLVYIHGLWGKDLYIQAQLRTAYRMSDDHCSLIWDVRFLYA